ncbi:hypothetical protein G9A89_005257 [Geosiphon pyriformis]|nr:hypothetical protein G9A89_005257 [Geosiphon pyriformis]
MQFISSSGVWRVDTGGKAGTWNCKGKDVGDCEGTGAGTVFEGAESRSLILLDLDEDDPEVDDEDEGTGSKTSVTLDLEGCGDLAGNTCEGAGKDGCFERWLGADIGLDDARGVDGIEFRCLFLRTTGDIAVARC